MQKITLLLAMLKNIMQILDFCTKNYLSYVLQNDTILTNGTDYDTGMFYTG